VQSCGGVSGKRCVCVPYNDPWMIAAQILAIVAIFFSWVWWPTFMISIVGFLMFQVPWFCRQKEGILHSSAADGAVSAGCRHLCPGGLSLVANENARVRAILVKVLPVCG